MSCTDNGRALREDPVGGPNAPPRPALETLMQPGPATARSDPSVVVGSRPVHAGGSSHREGTDDPHHRRHARGSWFATARSGGPDHHPCDAEDRVAPALRRPFSGPLIIDGGFEPAKGAAGIERDEVDRVAHGVKWLVNLDLPEHWKRATRLHDPVRETFLGRGRGYVDHPALAQLEDGPMAPVRALSNPSAEAR
jgi:hypothetical protein